MEGLPMGALTSIPHEPARLFTCNTRAKQRHKAKQLGLHPPKTALALAVAAGVSFGSEATRYADAFCTGVTLCRQNTSGSMLTGVHQGCSVGRQRRGRELLW